MKALPFVIGILLLIGLVVAIFYASHNFKVSYGEVDRVDTGVITAVGRASYKVDGKLIYSPGGWAEYEVGDTVVVTYYKNTAFVNTDVVGE